MKKIVKQNVFSQPVMSDFLDILPQQIKDRQRSGQDSGEGLNQCRLESRKYRLSLPLRPEPSIWNINVLKTVDNYKCKAEKRAFFAVGFLICTDLWAPPDGDAAPVSAL